MRFPRTLVIGGGGMIGSAVVARIRSGGGCVVATTRRSDAPPYFADLASKRWNLPEKSEVAILCAGATRFAECRSDQRGTRAVNVEGICALAVELVARGMHVVFLSTNSVFDGSVPHRRATDRPCPISEYGRQKAEAEHELQQLGGSVTICRFSKVVGERLPLIDQWVGSLRFQRAIQPFEDMYMSPLPLVFVVGVLLETARRRTAGIVQVSGEEDVSYSEVAQRLAERMGVPAGLVGPVSCRTGAFAESSPRHTTLDSTSVRDEFGLVPPSVRQTIDTVIAASLPAPAPAALGE